MFDANSILQALVTKTTSFNSTGYFLEGGTPVRGLQARLNVSAFASVGTAGTVFTPTIQESSDNTTFITIASGTPFTGATAAGTAFESFIAFRTRQPYCRLVMTLSPSSGTPSVSYFAEIGISQP